MSRSSATRLRQSLRRWHVGLLFVLLFASAASAQPLTGADVAYLVNQRYQSTVTQCAIDRPAWLCSGVLMRALPGDSGVTFDQLTQQETSLQSASVAYIRRDVETASLASSAGLILADGATAMGQGKPYEVRCAYPFTMSLVIGVASHGCNVTNATPPTPPDWSSCAAHGVSDAPGWVAYFRSQGDDVAKQCSLSATIASQFKASLEAHEQVSGLAASPTMLLLAAWDPAKPETIPLQAFYYDVANGGQLTQAQRYQLQYFDATGQWLPILRMYPAPGGATAFGFDERDQLDYGFTVTDQMNARFVDTAPCEGGRAAFYCNGVIVRVTGYGSVFKSWNPSPGAIQRDGVSFTYIRKDARVTHVANASSEGIVFAESNRPTQTPIVLRCIYPSDAGTDSRADRCGMYTSQLSRPCAQQGIVTLTAWRNLYNQTGWSNQCSMGVDTAAFDLSIQARSTFSLPTNIVHERWNELIIAPWAQNIPTQIPLEAVFYVEDALAGAQYIQQDYMNTTGRFIPVVRLNLDNLVTPFSYVPSDQGTARAGSVYAP